MQASRNGPCPGKPARPQLDVALAGSTLVLHIVHGGALPPRWTGTAAVGADGHDGSASRCATRSELSAIHPLTISATGPEPCAIPQPTGQERPNALRGLPAAISVPLKAGARDSTAARATCPICAARCLPLEKGCASAQVTAALDENAPGPAPCPAGVFGALTVLMPSGSARDGAEGSRRKHPGES